MAVLGIDNLTKRFGGVVAVDRFSMEISDGEVVGLIGPNGAGKTTVFNLITRLTPADAGAIDFQGRSLLSAAPHEVNRLGIARTFQNIRLFQGLNVLDNVKVALAQPETRYNIGEALLRLPRVWQDERHIESRARELLEKLGIARHARENPASLAYGLQRRLEIARALASNPALLLLDEPAAGLNPAEVADMTALIGQINRERGLTILLIEHHMDVVMPICNRIYVLNFGKLIAQGTPQQIQTNPEVLTAYLGEEE